MAKPASERESGTALIRGREVPFTLVRCRRRSIGLQVDGDGLTVRVPLRASRRWLQSALEDHAAWILSKLEEWSRRPGRLPAWSACAIFPLLGRDYALAPDGTGGFRPRELASAQLSLPFAHGLPAAEVELLMTAWYRERALACFRERVAHYAPRLGVAAPSVKLSNARSRWGSCSRATGIRLNWRLALFPLRLVDYVVAHELAHLVEMNHSPAFWRTVERIYPEYRSARRELGSLG